MIPHKLQLKNFLSYGNELQTIDFTGHRLIYLSGKNGHGKSALLDAMTWALWGQARKTTNAVKPDQGLLRLGQTHMVVIFDFELNGQLYRVRREYEYVQNKPIAHVEFGLINPDMHTMTPLTDKTIRLTQEVIEKTIRLDYESFVNSAFLRQGHANEFSQKSPKDRKEILGIILGLQQFDLLKRRAMDRVKDMTSTRQALTAVSDTLAQQLQGEQEVQAQLTVVETEIAAITVQEEEKQQGRATIAHERAAFLDRHKTAELLLFKKEEAERSTAQNVKQFKTQVAQWRLVNRKRHSLPDYTELERRKKEAGVALEQYQKRLQERIQLQEKLLNGKVRLQEQKMMLEKQHAHKLQEVQLACSRLSYEKQTVFKAQEQAVQQKGKLAARAASIQEERELIAKSQWLHEELERQGQQFEKRKSRYQQWMAQDRWLRAELERLHQKHAFAHDNNPSCPLCEQTLSAARRKFLRAQFEMQQASLTHQLTRISKLINRLKLLLVEQHDQLRKQQELQAKSVPLDMHMQEMKQQMQTIEEEERARQREYAQLEEQVAVMQKQRECVEKETALGIERNDVYQNGKKEIDLLEHALTKVPYDENAHKTIQQTMQIIERQIADYVIVQHELHAQRERCEAIAQLAARIKQQKQDVIRYQKELEPYATFAQEAVALTEKEKAADEAIRAVRIQKEQLVGTQGRLRNSIEQFAKFKKEREVHHAQIKKLDEEIADYQAIALAVGKEGIQALLIEEAIPEIEQEANYLLGKLTNNQAQVFIESLRDLKRGGSKETLDVNIADSSGIRPYELFSGGEAFRIDFALRIAISKLLARRAGTALQTLIIDEGFGSQDEEGLSLIMDAIYRIQDDFEKVLVVSHLPSMRDQFPVHFIVSKGAQGSHIQVVEQG